MNCFKKKKINKINENFDLIYSDKFSNIKPKIITIKNIYKDNEENKIIDCYYPDNAKIYKGINDAMNKFRSKEKSNIKKIEVEHKNKINKNGVEKSYIRKVEKSIDRNNNDTNTNKFLLKKNVEDNKKINHYRFKRLCDNDEFYKYNNLKMSNNNSNISSKNNDLIDLKPEKKYIKKKATDRTLDKKKKNIYSSRTNNAKKNNSKKKIKSSEMKNKIIYLKKLIKKKDDNNKIFLKIKSAFIYFKAKMLMKNEELQNKILKKIIYEKSNKEIRLKQKLALVYYRAKILEINEELKLKALKKIIFEKKSKKFTLKQKFSLFIFKTKMIEKNEKLKIKALKRIIYEKINKEKHILFKYFFKFYKKVCLEIINSKNNQRDKNSHYGSDNLIGFLKENNNNKLFNFKEDDQNCTLKKYNNKRDIDEKNNNIINNKKLKGIIREQESFDSDDEKPKKIYGFINELNNCYLNSSLQLLTRVKDLEKQILKYNDISKENITKGKLIVEFQKILNLIKNDEKVINPNKIKRVMGKIDDKYYLNNQEDASEFISDFLDALYSETITENKLEKLKEIKINEIDEEAYNNFYNKFFKRRGYSFLSNIFYGILRHQKLCKNCKNMIIKFNAYNMLKLPIYELLENNNDTELDLKKIINNYVSEYKNDNAVCRKCNQKEIYSKTSIFSLPKYLIIFFARIVDGQYLDKEIKYPKEFRINDYFDENKKTDINKNYTLECVIEHTGGIYSGHYTALCLIDKNNKCWYKFNDRLCDKISREPQSKKAIILLYSKSI